MERLTTIAEQFRALTVEDVQPEKREAFEILKPHVLALIEEFTNK